MARLEFVAGVLDGLEMLEAGMAAAPDIIAERFLHSTLVDEPRPPWESGELRNSGAVYIGGRLHMTTADLAATDWQVERLLAPNPAFFGVGTGKFAESTGRAKGRHKKLGPLVPQLLRGDKLHIGFMKYYKGLSKSDFTLRNKITVMYQAPHALLMHEWAGNFSDAKSGAHFISSKAFMLEYKVAFAYKGLY